MGVNQVIDAMAGDELSKNELKISYKKAFRLGSKVAIITFLAGLICFFILFPDTFKMPNPFHPQDFDWFAFIFKLIFSIFPAVGLGVVIGSLSLNALIKHLKITLPESIAPRVEIKDK